ncbi:aromatic-ring-hydroxylating dioxygenase subunit beta [Candidatus Poriferisodalis sp.]|uniref:aromatic-ring-hydroxylating dioxygenase subunit beta n=1 Tax=Candidatus Poriferisodalis sp. TaxID=3101277 RepID=UPI003B014DD8
MPAVDEATRREIEEFLYHEAVLADESRYEDWVALVTDDIHYWVPFGAGDYEPGSRVSFLNDNRNRLKTRIQQLMSGRRYSQVPQSPMRRIISNIQILAVHPDSNGDEYEVGSNFVLYEHAVQATNAMRIWVGRTTHRLRRTDEGLRIAAKKVELVNSTSALPNMAFII